MYFTPQVKPCFRRERKVKPEIFGTKNAMQRKNLTLAKLLIKSAAKIFGKIMLKPL